MIIPDRHEEREETSLPAATHIRKFDMLRSFRLAYFRALLERTNRCLNIGCQTNRCPGWLNVDNDRRQGSVYMDATEQWPIADNALNAILCEHMIEHVSKTDGMRLLQEARRTLRPGGVIRIISPSLSSFIDMYINPKSKNAVLYRNFLESRHGELSNLDIFNMIFYCYGHKHIYTAEEMTKMLKESGFAEIVQSKVDQPISSVFLNCEGHSRLVGREINAIEAFALEATA